MKALQLAALTLLPVALSTLSGCSSAPERPPAAEASSTFTYAEGVPGGIAVSTIDMKATVAKIDHAARSATLMSPDGKLFTVKAGPEAIHFDQVRVGDQVQAVITEELVVHLEGAGGPALQGSAAVVALAPKGAQPGGVAAETTQVTGTVTAIDKVKRTATITFDDGTRKTLPVRDDLDLNQRRTGERVVFRVTQMIAISIQKAK